MIKLIVIGAGKWGRNHIRTAYELGVLGGVVESNNESLAFIKKEYPDVAVFQSLDDDGVLAFDAFSVAVPAAAHFEVAKFLLEHKKHVLVEKPITLTVADAEELDKLATTNGCILMVGHLLLFHPAFKKMKALVQENKIGKLQYMYSNRLNLGTVRTELNSLWSFAPHDFSLFQYFSEAYPSTIESHGGAFVQPHIHDTTMTVLRYPENLVGHIFVSWLHPFKEHRFVLIGSKGMLVYEDSTAEKALLFYEKGIDWIAGEPIKRDGAVLEMNFSESQPLKTELQHFLACILGKENNTIINAKKGVEVLKLLTKAQDSLDNKG